MQLWAQELQKFNVLNSSDPLALRRAAKECEDHEVRTFLPKIPPTDGADFETGRRITTRLADQGRVSEAIVLNIAIIAPILSDAENAGQIDPDRRKGYAELLEEFTRNCRYSEHLLPSLTLLLRLKSAFYAELGNFEIASKSFEEACDILKQLADTGNRMYTALLASALDGLGVLYSEMSKYARASKALKEAYRLRKKLAATEPEKYRCDLAISLHNLGNFHCYTHDYHEALTSYKEACGIFSELASPPNGKYEKKYALSLESVGLAYSYLGEYECALRAQQKAHTLIRELFSSEPLEYLPNLARSLHNVGCIHDDLTDYQSACESLAEACTHYGELAKQDPELFETKLAISSNALGVAYSKRQDFTSAVTALSKAVEIYSRLAASSPQIYEIELARSKVNLGNVHLDQRDYTAARKTLEEACTHFERLASSDPQTYQPDLAVALLALGNFFADIRNFPKAREAYDRSCKIYRELAAVFGGQHREGLFSCLNNIGVLSRETNDSRGALAAYEEVRNTLTEMVREQPRVFESDLAVVNSNIANSLSDLGQFDAAKLTYEETISIRERLSVEEPMAYRGTLAESLHNLGSFLNDRGKPNEAIRHLGEAEHIFSDLVLVEPDVYSFKLSKTLNNLGKALYQVSDTVGAKSAFEKAVRLAENASDVAPAHLNKGGVLESYRALLQDSVDDGFKAFSISLAMREARTQYNSVKLSDFAETRRILGERRHGLLIANRGLNNTVVLGLISNDHNDWHSIETSSWSDLSPSSVNTLGHSERVILASKIWEALPGAVRDFLAPSNKSVKEIWVSGDQFFASFPWEILRFGEGEFDFLGLSRALPRIGSFRAEEISRFFSVSSLGGRSQVVSIVAPHLTGKIPLEGTLREFEYLKRRVPEIGGSIAVAEVGESANEAVMRRAIRSNPSLLYFSGHGEVIGNEEVLVFESEEFFEDEDRRNLSYLGRWQLSAIAFDSGRASLFENAPLMVLNCCKSGRHKEHGGKREDLVGALLDQGIGAVLATAMPIFDAVGEAFGLALFSDEALACDSMGELVVEARNQLARGICAPIGLPFWGAWSMVHLHGAVDAKPPFFKEN